MDIIKDFYFQCSSPLISIIVITALYYVYVMGLITKYSLISYNDTVPLADKLQCDILSLINSLFV